jgi:2-phosphoglycolate phosphatase
VRRAAAIFFDLDGTLLDTAPDMIGALNLLRAELGCPALALADLRHHVSHGASRLVTVGFPEAQGGELERLRRRFLDLYAANLAHGTRPFPGMESLLHEFDAAGLPWGIVTNKPAWLTDPLLAALGLSARARCVVSGDTVAERKPHPLPMLHAAALTGVAAPYCVYVGDTERDIIAGRAAGMQTVVAAYGYLGAADDPKAWDATGIVHRPDEISGWLQLRHLEDAQDAAEAS